MAVIKTSKGDIRYRSKILYVGIKQIDKEVALDNLKVLHRILSKTNLHWGPSFGTLLGIVRDNDFITWDEDIDLYILEEEEEIFKNALWEMIESGFEIVRYERRGLYSIMRNGEYIDFYVLRSIAPELRHTGGGGFIFDKYITNTKQIDFKGIMIDIPQDCEEFLSFQYGDWRTPVQWANYEMTAMQKFLVKCKYHIKNNLPNFLYYFLIKKFHTKDLEKFKEKCIKKGCPIDSNIKLSYKKN